MKHAVTNICPYGWQNNILCCCWGVNEHGECSGISCQDPHLLPQYSTHTEPKKQKALQTNPDKQSIVPVIFNFCTSKNCS